MKRRNQKESKPPPLSLRIIPVFIGLLLMLRGIYGSRNGIVWRKSFSQRTGPSALRLLRILSVSELWLSQSEQYPGTNFRESGADSDPKEQLSNSLQQNFHDAGLPSEADSRGSFAQ